jgi:hypothetical protein
MGCVSDRGDTGLKRKGWLKRLWSEKVGQRINGKSFKSSVSALCFTVQLHSFHTIANFGLSDVVAARELHGSTLKIGQFLRRNPYGKTQKHFWLTIATPDR